MTDSRLGQGKVKEGSETFVVPESKVQLKNLYGYVKKTRAAALKSTKDQI